jgi:hypothetical protein
LETNGLSDIYDDLVTYSEPLVRLYTRADARYLGKDVIRTQAGAIPKAPQMTTVWKQEVAASPMRFKMDNLNNKVATRLGGPWEDIKLTHIYAQTKNLIEQYRHPPSVVKVQAIEMGLSVPMNGDPNHDDPLRREDYYENPVYLPSGRMFTGFIDLVAINYKGETIIVDHKTSGGDAPTEFKVKNHEQLLVYCYLWKELTGELPAKIAINHIKTGQFIQALVDPDLVAEAVARHDGLAKAIDHNIFVKRAPFEYGSPCLGSESSAKTACIFLQTCHREVAVSLGVIS